MASDLGASAQSGKVIGSYVCVSMSQNVSVCVKRMTHMRLTPFPIPPFLLSLPPFLLSPDRLSASLPLVGVEPFAVLATLVDLARHRGSPPSGVRYGVVLSFG